MADPKADTAAEPPKAGLRVGDRYVLGRLLGRGGMGEVWYAEDEQGEGPVALKFMRPKDGATPSTGARTRMVREARAAERIRHPNVVELYGVVDDPEHGPVLVMEYLEGEPLSARLERGEALSLEDASGLALELCEGLAAAHAAGVVHRDLKPGNVILVQGEGEDHWRACIVDFGVARLLSTTLEAVSSTGGGFAGTPLYMAPEQLLGGTDVDHRADVWSLGLVLFAALTGRTPTEGEHLGEVLRNVLDRPMPRARSVAPSVPPPLDEALARALSRERKARPSLAELAAAFAPYAGREVPQLPAPRVASPAVKPDETAALDETASIFGADRTPDALARPDLPESGAGHDVAAEARAAAGLVSAEPSTGSSPTSLDGKRPRPAKRVGRGVGLVAVAISIALLGVGAFFSPAWRAVTPGVTQPVGSFAVLAPVDGLSADDWAAHELGRALAQRWAVAGGPTVLRPEVGAKSERARALVRGEEGAARAAAEALGVEALVVVRPAERAGRELGRVEVYTKAGGFRPAGAKDVDPGSDPAELFGAARFVRERLGLRDDGAGEGGLVALGLPRQPEPLRHTLLAERALRAGDLTAARREIEAEGMAAASLDAPALQLTWARVKAAEGHAQVAGMMAMQALGKSDHVIGDERPPLKAEAYWFALKFDQALDEQRALWAARPEVLEHGYRLAEMLFDRSNLAEAGDLLVQIAGKMRPEGDEGRVELLLGLVRLARGEREAGRRGLATALERATRAGNTQVAARAELALATHLAGDDAAAAKGHAERALSLFTSKGDGTGLGQAELALAEVALATGRPAEALDLVERARRAFAPWTESTADEVAAKDVEARATAQRGDFVAANGAASYVFAVVPNLPGKHAVVRGLITGASIDVNMFMGPQAMVRSREAAEISKGIGYRTGLAAALRHVALGHLRAGEPEPARAAAVEAVAIEREAGVRLGLAQALDALGLVGLAAGRTAEARAHFEEALRLREEGGFIVTPVRLKLAAVLRVEGRLGEALATCQAAVDEFRERGLVEQEAQALTLLAELALGERDVARARAAAQRAISLGDTWLSMRSKQALTPTLAALEAPSDASTAPGSLNVGADLKAMSNESMRLSMQLSRARNWLRTGKQDEGRALLKDVAAEARKTGHDELARRAEQALAEGR